MAGLAQKLTGSKRLTTIIVGAMVLECVPLWFSVYLGFGVALGMQLVSGVGMVIVDVLAFTTLQRDLPREVLGRVLGTVDVLTLGSAVAASVLGSFLYSTLGIGWALGVLGLGIPFLSLFGIPVLLRLDADMAQKAARLEPVTGILVRLDLLAGAPRSLIEHLAESAEERTLSAGEMIIRQGDPSDAFWVLTEGALSIKAVRDDGTPVDLPDVDAPGYVGELGLMNRTVRSATVTTKTACRLLHIPGPDFSAALESAAPSPGMLGLASVRTQRTSTTARAVAVADRSAEPTSGEFG